MRLLLLPILGALAAPALAADAPAGKSCISLGFVKDQRVAGGRIYFKEGTQWYANDMPACPALRYDRRLDTRTPGTNLCEGQPVQIVGQVDNFFYGSCPLGRFVPIDKPPPRDRPR